MRKPRLQWKLYVIYVTRFDRYLLKICEFSEKKKTEILSKLETTTYSLLAIRYYSYEGYYIMQSVS